MRLLLKAFLSFVKTGKSQYRFEYIKKRGKTWKKYDTSSLKERKNDKLDKECYQVFSGGLQDCLTGLPWFLRQNG